MSAQLSLLQTDDVSSAEAMPSWVEHKRGYPTSLASTSLFTTGHGPRKIYEHFSPLMSASSVDIFYRGEELREESDKPVWLQLIHWARGQSVRTDAPIEVRFVAADMLKKLGWPTSSTYYRQLDDCLQRMVGAQVKIKSHDCRRSRYMVMPLIAHLAYEGPDQFSTYAQYKVHINHVAAQVFASGYIELDIHKTSALARPMAKKIYDIVLAAKTNGYTIRIEDLRDLLGSSSKSVASFKQNVKKALDELIDSQLIKHYAFEGRVMHVHLESFSQNRTTNALTYRVHQPNALPMEELLT